MTAASIPHSTSHEGRRATFAALFLFSLILGFVGALAVQLPNVRLHQLGVPGAAIGFSTALQALGIVRHAHGAATAAGAGDGDGAGKDEHGDA